MNEWLNEWLNEWMNEWILTFTCVCMCKWGDERVDVWHLIHRFMQCDGYSLEVCREGQKGRWASVQVGRLFPINSALALLNLATKWCCSCRINPEVMADWVGPDGLVFSWITFLSDLNCIPAASGFNGLLCWTPAAHFFYRIAVLVWHSFIGIVPVSLQALCRPVSPLVGRLALCSS